MQHSTTEGASSDFVVTHPLDPEDVPTVTAMRAMASSTKGMLRGIEAREPFDALMESVLPSDDVAFKSETVGSIAGTLGSSCALSLRRSNSPSARRMVQLGNRQGIPPSCRANRR